MKKLTYILIFSVASGFLSCVDLVEEPVNQLRTNYFKDLTSLKTAINGTYSVVISNIWERSVQVGSFQVPLMGADDLTTLTGSNKEDWRQFDQFYQSSGNARMERATWALLYDVIRQANWDIEGSKALEGKYDQAEIDALLGESYFLRAWSYYWLVRVFGGVPLILSAEVGDDVYDVVRSSELEVYNQILSDLDFAETHLPVSQPAYGYVNKWVAKAYLAEVHLTMAGWPLNLTDHYVQARDYAKEVMDNGPFQLMSDYPSLFTMENQGDANTESIWAISLCGIEDCGGGFTGSWMAKATKPAELNGWQDMYIELSYFNRFPEGERKDFVMLTEIRVSSDNVNDPYYVRADGDTVHYTYQKYTNFTTSHPYLKKYWDGFYDSTLVADDPQQVTSAQSGLDLPMMRLAKINLIYAEAQARVDGAASPLSYELLNQIRRRGKGYDLNAVGSDVDIATGSLTEDEFVIAVVDEKGWEFIGELNRWFDLIRTERVEEVTALRSPDEPLKIQNTPSKQYYRAPIPFRDLSLNPGMEQNPGYIN